MATGSGLGSLIPLALTVAGIVAMVRGARRRRRSRAEDETGGPDTRRADTRRDGAREMERRMASYLAERDAARHSGGGSPASPDQGRENGQ